MFFNDVYLTIILSFLISIASAIILLVATILFAIFYKKSKNNKHLRTYVLVLVLTLLGEAISLPWLFVNAGLSQADTEIAAKNYKMALNTSIFPNVKAEVYDIIAQHYYTTDKNIPLAIKNCEAATKLKKDSPTTCILWSMYLINENYDKALKEIKSMKTPHAQLESMVYMTKGDAETAIKVMDEKINLNPTGWDYAYRANFYENSGKSILAQKDYQKALELMPNLRTNKKFNEMRSNKDYFKNLQENNRIEYNLK